MGHKEMSNSLGFADLALASSLKHNRSLRLINKLNDAIEWNHVEQILMAHIPWEPVVKALTHILRYSSLTPTFTVGIIVKVAPKSSGPDYLHGFTGKPWNLKRFL